MRNSIIVILAFLAACDFVKIKDEVEDPSKAQEPIARVNENYLYATEIVGLVSILMRLKFNVKYLTIVTA